MSCSARLPPKNYLSALFLHWVCIFILILCDCKNFVLICMPKISFLQWKNFFEEIFLSSFGAKQSCFMRKPFSKQIAVTEVVVKENCFKSKVVSKQATTSLPRSWQWLCTPTFPLITIASEIIAENNALHSNKPHRIRSTKFLKQSVRQSMFLHYFVDRYHAFLDVVGKWNNIIHRFKRLRFVMVWANKCKIAWHIKFLRKSLGFT